MSGSEHDPIGYAEFGDWYDAYRVAVLEPALDAATDALQSELEDSLGDRDLARIRSISTRVKSKRRTWRKVNHPRYRPLISDATKIPTVIDDLIGMRLTCTNLRDLEMVQEALESLPRHTNKRRPLALDPTSERDYVEHPKQSGYRGWHVNLGIEHDGSRVTCELQVRTVLQDSWGELTHEDSYSKAGELPPLVEVLSTRMADLLATLDDIAEDIRSELDRIDEAILAEHADERADTATALVSGPGADAADLVRTRWRELDRPLELSSLAWALQHEFGAEVSDDWFGFGAFKRFLTAAIPDADISRGRHAYLLPASESDQPDADASDDGTSTVPDEARQLRRVDRGFPLVETAEWQRMYQHLAAAWDEIGAAAATNQTINRLSRSARDRARASGEPLSRRHLGHVARAVLTHADDPGPLTAEQIADVFATTVLERLADLRIVAADNAAGRTRIGRWLLGSRSL